MKIKFKGFSLKYKFILIMLVVSLIPMVFYSYYSITNSNQAIKNGDMEKLTAVRDIKAAQVENFFNDKIDSLFILSQTPTLIEAFEEINNTFKDSRLDSREYSNIDQKYRSYLETASERFGYRDLLLINNQGDIVFSRAQNMDLGTNLLNGQYDNSNLATAFQKGLKELSITDYKYYSPVDSSALFISAPIRDNNQVIGVMAVQVLDSRIDRIVNEVSGMGKTGEIFLVGEDKLMRSNSRFSEETTILEREINTTAVAEAFANKTDVKIIDNYNGVPVLSTYKTLNIPGINWAIVAEIDENEVLAVVNKILKATYIQLAVLALLVGLVAYFFANRITKPILQAVNLAREIAEGNLKAPQIEVKSKDEVGVLGNSLNKMMQSLQKIINQVADLSDDLAASSEELSASGEEVAASAEQVGGAIQQVASGAEEQTAQIIESKEQIGSLIDQIEDVDKDSTEMNEQADDVMNILSDGRKLLNGSITKVINVRNNTSDVAVRINALGDLSREIGNIIELINSIADQTNLLALNAAIEAARAGEAGRGFSVVADEIRDLAEESTSATEEIAQLIADIQSRVEKAVSDMKESEVIVGESEESIKETGLIFTKISKAAEKLKELIENTSSNTKQMNQKSTRVEALVEEIAHVSEDTASNAEEVAASGEEQAASTEEIVKSADDLAQMAINLTNLVSEFEI